MKPFYLLVLLLLLACASLKQSSYSFEDGIGFLKSLDSKYSTNFKVERVDINYLDINSVDPFQQDLEAFKQRLWQDPDSLDKKKLLWLVEARKQMLESERLYQLGVKFGNFSLMDEAELCQKRSQAEFQFKYFKTAMAVGINATRFFDAVLQDYEPAQRLVGVDENKPNFYLSNWDATNIYLSDLAEALREC